MNQNTKPCGECPFSKRIPPGELGGSPPEVYVGQIFCGFWLPCHCSPGYVGKATNVNDVAQCAGAAQFRANIGISDRMPRGLLRLPPGSEALGSLAEFYAHHTGCTLAEAEAKLTPRFVKQCMLNELSRADVRVQLKKV